MKLSLWKKQILNKRQKKNEEKSFSKAVCSLFVVCSFKQSFGTCSLSSYSALGAGRCAGRCAGHEEQSSGSGRILAQGAHGLRPWQPSRPLAGHCSAGRPASGGVLDSSSLPAPMLSSPYSPNFSYLCSSSSVFWLCTSLSPRTFFPPSRHPINLFFKSQSGCHIPKEAFSDTLSPAGFVPLLCDLRVPS